MTGNAVHRTGICVLTTASDQRTQGQDDVGIGLALPFLIRGRANEGAASRPPTARTAGSLFHPVQNRPDDATDHAALD